MRDDFTKRTIETLADRAGNRCSNPNCRKSTSGPRTDPTKAINVGVAAHITAASEDGPRYDPALSSNQRKHPDNGIWLCQNCAKLIDNDPDRYPVGLLREWKEQTEQAALHDIEHGFVQRIVHVFAGDTETQRMLRNRQAMLKLVHNTWIKGVLEQSLHGAAMIELGMENRADAVERPWDMVVQMPGERRRQLPPNTRIIDIFDKMNQSLLILGEPGSGKTTTLLDLARDALVRADQDLAQPIPVVFDLSSWAGSGLSIGEWLVAELKAKYLVPVAVARGWLGNDELLLLLDGLDEVAEGWRSACVAALSAFRQEHLVPMAVCSRTAEYEKLPARLGLHGAILLQPLSPDQVFGYLESTSSDHKAIRSILEQDAALLELARSPLMLTILTLTCEGTLDQDGESLASLGTHRREIFAAYVRSMFERRAGEQPYTPAETIYRLSWLAAKMSKRSQSIFLIESLQMDWLSKSAQGGTIFFARFLAGLALGLPLGLGFGLAAGMQGGVQQGLITGQLIMMFVGLTAGLTVRVDAVRPIEHVEWSWQRALKRLTTSLHWIVLNGLLATVIGWWGLGREKGLLFGLGMGVFTTLAFLFFLGWAGFQVETRMIPNQGILMSLSNALFLGVVWGLVSGLVSGPLWGLFFDSLTPGVIAGSLAGLSIGFFFSGGRPVILHYVIRNTLQQEGVIPRWYAHFLDYAADRIFLRKVGGGYIFVHRLLQEYFASLWDEKEEA